MLDQFRVRLASLQEEITASVKNLSSTPSFSSGTPCVEGINLNAGSELLECYQNTWVKLRISNEDNVARADQADAAILRLRDSLENQWSLVSTLEVLTAQIPDINKSILEIMNNLGNMESLFSDVEISLFALEDIIEAGKLQEKQLDQRFQLAIYQERRQAEYEDLAAGLQKEHQKRLQETEMKRCLKNQEECEKAFARDLSEYSRTGKLPSTSREIDIEVTLETVDLNADDDYDADRAKLELFLSESNDTLNASNPTPSELTNTQSLNLTTDSTIENFQSLSLDSK